VQAVVACYVTAPRVCTLVLFILIISTLAAKYYLLDHNVHVHCTLHMYCTHSSNTKKQQRRCPENWLLHCLTAWACSLCL